MSCCSSFFVVRSWSGAERVDVLSHRGAGQTALEPQGSGEGSSALRQVIARGRGVQVRTAAVCSAVRIGYDGWTVRIRAGDHPQQLALQGPLTTSDAGPDRSDQGWEPISTIRARVNDVFANHFNGV